jgi:hypothetical protein
MWTIIGLILVGILFLGAMASGIIWIVDGFRIKKGTYKATKSEIEFSHIGYGFLLAAISLINLLDTIIMLVKK